MNVISNLSARQLRAAADIKEKIQGLERQLDQLVNGQRATFPFALQKRKPLSARAIANIRAGVRKRQAAIASSSKTKKPQKRRKRRMSAAGRAALAAAVKARWAKAKATGRKAL